VSLRKGHGAGAGVPRIEVLPADEQSQPVPADAPSLAGVTRRQNGTVDSSKAAKALGTLGGKVKARRVRLARSLGLNEVDASSEAFAPYKRSASAFRKHHCKAIADQAGGHCGTGPSSIAASASLQLAASRFLFDRASRTGDPADFITASRLANDSRQNLLAAYELAVREAQARPRAPVDPIAAFRLPNPVSER
jgi:hypothetical protein